MTHNYSENWSHLESILIGYSRRKSTHQHYSYTDHSHAKALSIFLVNAALATPKLDRTTVEAVLTGQKSWPHISGLPQAEHVGVPLSLLEANGLVAFYAGWCTVHCQTVINLDDVDPSLIPLIQAVEYLKNISFGRNGYIRPHYECAADHFNKSFDDQFGRISIAELLPELCLEDGRYKLPPGNQSFSSLVSTYLWRALRESLDPKEAFAAWILCLRVNCDWAMPILLDNCDYEILVEFRRQLLDYITEDTALGFPENILWRQLISEGYFVNIIAPIETHVRLKNDAEGASRSEHHVTLKKVTLETLSDAYSLPSVDHLSDLQSVRKWQGTTHWRQSVLFYTSLLATTIEESIRIDGHTLTSSDFAEAVFELAISRPILKHMLFNLVPSYGEAISYTIFLLSRTATCDVALFYLTRQSFSNSYQNQQSFARNFDKGYQQLVCHEYLRAIGNDDCGNRLLEAVEFLGDRCNLEVEDFSKSSAYQFIFCLLDNLSQQQVIQLGKAFISQMNQTNAVDDFQLPQHYWYLLGFWLIERIEAAGIDPADTLSDSLKTMCLGYYKADFERSLAGHRHGLQPNAFFSALPWHKFIGHKGIGPLLALSSNCCGWQQSLMHLSKHNVTVASAVRHYLQVLMCVGRPQRVPAEWKRVAIRIAEIVRTLGFGPREHGTYLFGAFYSDEYDLWTPFCSYANLFQDELYDDFLERTMLLIPLNHLFVLLECCTVIARAQKLQEAIAERESHEAGDLGLSDFEQAFISAWDSNHRVLAKKLIIAAKDFLSKERFAGTKNPKILRARKVWATFEYKWELTNLLETLRHDPDKFSNATRQIPIPHADRDMNCQNVDKEQRRECEYFRRYIIGAAYREIEPQKCVDIMAALYKETRSSIHSFMLFSGRLALHKDAMGLRYALSQFLISLGDTEPEDLPIPWIAAILDVYQQLQDTLGIDAFWMKLTPDQQNRIEILHPYCKALIARGEALVAQQIVNRYRELNHQVFDQLGIDDLIDELSKALPSKLSISQLVQVVNEGSQRNIAQLARHYSQIVSREFAEYVAIVDQRSAPHEFLKNAVLAVAQELLLRKKNLQIHSSHTSNHNNRRITKEDLINDWFTSLFDNRMTEARIGFRDQKRGGQSSSGKGPGEIDGYITDGKNKRIAIFEAFRLFSKDTTVIAEHLDKISGYDNESLSPVFIVAYCDVSDFNELACGYADYIENKAYAGFTFDSTACNKVDTLVNTGQLWLSEERRHRGQHEVIFYHLLLNMDFREKLNS